MTVRDSDSDNKSNATEQMSHAERYTKIFQHSNDGILIVDPDTESIVDTNPAACEMLGYARQELLSLDLIDLHPDDIDRVRTEFFTQVTDEGSGWTDDLTCTTKSGEKIPIEVSGARLEEGESDSDSPRLVVMLRDITARKEREREIRKSFDELEGILDNLNDLVFLHDADGTMRYVNDSAVTRLGYPEARLMEKSPEEFLPQEEVERYPELVERVSQEGSVTFETTMVTAQDERVPVEISTSTIQFRGDPAFLSVARDIGDRKERERELRRFKKAVEQAAHIVYITDPDGTIEYVNRAFEQQTGYTAEEAIGETPNLLTSGTHDEPFFADLWETILSGEVWQQEIVNERADGTEYYVDQTIAPIQDDTGEIEAFVVINTDITERKKLEEELTEQRDSLDVLNQVLRHDIRNDLQLVIAHADLLADLFEEGSEAREHVETINESADHAVELTRTAREMATVVLEDADDHRPMNLRSVLVSELDDCETSYPGAIIRADEPLPQVQVNANEMLASVFRNLLKNATQHNDKDVPEVEISVTIREETVLIRVADNGPGVANSQKDEIFGKGQKGLDSQGSGLGLFLVKTLVEEFGGDIWLEENRAEDADTEGSVFVVELPIVS